MVEGEGANAYAYKACHKLFDLCLAGRQSVLAGAAGRSTGTDKRASKC